MFSKSILSAAFVLLASSAAFAFPAVNDSVTFDGNYTQAGNAYPLTLTNSIKSFNAQTSQFLVSEVQTLAGQTQSQDSLVNQDDLISSAQVQSLIANCQAQGGALETVATQAGSFDTCRLSQQGEDGGLQTYWFANVPFGLAKYTVNGQNDDGQPYSIELALKAYTVGQ